jgi:hypothetical protein
MCDEIGANLAAANGLPIELFNIQDARAKGADETDNEATVFDELFQGLHEIFGELSLWKNKTTPRKVSSQIASDRAKLLAFGLRLRCSLKSLDLG